jgi:hypothetical protein
MSTIVIVILKEQDFHDQKHDIPSWIWYEESVRWRNQLNGASSIAFCASFEQLLCVYVLKAWNSEHITGLKQIWLKITPAPIEW